MQIYTVLSVVAVIMTVLALILVIITIKNIAKPEQEEKEIIDKGNEKEAKTPWKDFCDINENEEKKSKVNAYSDDYADDVKTTGTDFLREYQKKRKEATDRKNTGFDSEKTPNGFEGRQNDAYSDMNDQGDIFAYDDNDEFDTVSLDGKPSFHKTDIMPALDKISVTLKYNDNGVNKKLRMTADKLRVGRELNNDLKVMQNSYMGRRHAVFEIEGNRLFLRDLNSKNGTFVDGKRINGRVALNESCTVRFGDFDVEVIIDD